MEKRIGGHVSCEGGVLNAIKEAKKIGANTIQIFGASPVQWKAPLPDTKVADAFARECKTNNISPIFLHAPYLINLASPKGNLAGMSKTLLEKHLRIADMLGACGVIFHIGSRQERDKKEAQKMVADALAHIIDIVPHGFLLIENSAGAGNLVGSDPEEIGDIISMVKNKRVGFCLDTAHAFEAGILSDFSKKSVDEFVKKIDNTIGLEKLLAIHVNDSKTPANSNKDRHENIGQGLIGEQNLKTLLTHQKLFKVPLILEVPGLLGEGPDKENISIVKSFFE